MGEDIAGRRLARLVHGAVAAALALAIFALDALSPLQGAVAVLYTIVVLLASRGQDRVLIIAAGAGGVALAITGYIVGHWGEPFGSPAMRLAVSLTAISITTLLCARNFTAASERRRSDRRYRTIFDAAGFPIWETDWSATYARLQSGDDPEKLAEFAVNHGIIRDFNQAAADMFGVADCKAMIGGTTSKFHTPASQIAVSNVLRGLGEGQTTISEETQFRTAAGETVDVILRVTLPQDHDGWKRVLIVALDVTERNRTQARLAQAQSDLTHISRVTTLGQLAASIAHEVNQPLSAIITYAKSGKRWLAREAADAPEVADCLDQIASNGARAADVIARVRDLARKADPQHSWIDLARLVEETVALLRRDLETNGVTIRNTISGSLPQVMGDKVQIQQVLMNLMLNATQAMADTPPDERELCIDATSGTDGITVAISDCGTGIASDHETLFAPFVTTKASGMGMGLSICRSIIEQHGGKLAAANNARRGATFRFNLPVNSEGKG